MINPIWFLGIFCLWGVEMKKEKTIWVQLAELSAIYDPNIKSWWGMDTDVGNLPERIRKLFQDKAHPEKGKKYMYKNRFWVKKK